ncbi:MAG: hypothetical protein QMD01_03285 [Thermodesulfovibrionales bacterium]|nr:hypothetical protein [Thermodesulfovibrionales bacterium]
MLEFNQWFFVLLANFLILFFILNAILFKPLANVFKEREKAVSGTLSEAKGITVRKESAISQMNVELLSAKNNAKEIYNSLRAEGISSQKEMLMRAEAEAVEMIERARKELKEDAKKARAALKADIEKFSEDIVNKLVKA